MVFALYSFASWSRLQSSKDDDWADRISHLWTVVLLAFFTILVSSAQYVGDPIQCWCPAQFTGSYVSYTKSVCWISNTYYIPMDDSIPVNIHERQKREISYYQWVPIILLFQALMFKFPNMVWKMLNSTGGLNVDRLVSLSESTQIGKQEDREKMTYQVAKYLDRWLKAHRQYHYNLLVRLRQRFSNVFCFWFAKRDGKYLTGFYLFVKFLYVANVIFQFYILNHFLAMNYSVFGLEVIEALVKEGSYTDSPRFPRVTLCDFEIRQMANVQRYTVQCVLPINLFNEKIFIFLWFWYLLVSAVTVFNYLAWLYQILLGGNRYRYVKKYLKLGDNIRNKTDAKLARKFADEYLRDDGVFVLKIVSKNSSELVLSDLINHLWLFYIDNPHTTLPHEKRQREAKMNGKNAVSTLELDIEELRELNNK
ncbi:innexin unc-9-like [Biomphalaria glabrata]|uniref:Innexin n=1 Tax=Biomphalaria glabrata TaxID=6526 RepID=A0A9W2Z6H0_BIOGL|nr:innexin unc-9-like [Biomphalaria glabrata]